MSKETKRGEFSFVVDHVRVKQGKYRVPLVKSLRGDVVDQETLITVEPDAGSDQPAGGSQITVRMTATVNEANVVEINMGLRKSMRLMQTLMERTLDR